MLNFRANTTRESWATRLVRFLALVDDDTHDMLLRTENATAKSGMALSAFLVTTRTMCCYLHGNHVGQIGGGPYGMALSALFDDDTRDALLLARKTPQATPAKLSGIQIPQGVSIDKRKGRSRKYGLATAELCMWLPLFHHRHLKTGAQPNLDETNMFVITPQGCTKPCLRFRLEREGPFGPRGWGRRAPDSGGK